MDQEILQEAAQDIVHEIVPAAAKTTKGMLVIASVLSFAAGVAIGTYFANKRLKNHYDEMASKEISEAREYYKKFYKSEDYDTPESAAAILIPVVEPEIVEVEVPDHVSDALRTYGGVVPEHNIFTSPLPPGALAVIDKDDSEEPKPFWLTQDEFMNGELDYMQNSITWYQGDSVLADTNDEPILEIEQTVGLENLSRFGEGEDPNIIYVRNPRIQIDFEIALSTGKYSKEVGGFDEDETSFAHSEPMRRRSRRFVDD